MKKIFLSLVLLTQYIHCISFNYETIPLFLGAVGIGRSLWVAKNIRKHNNLVPEAINVRHRLETGCETVGCEETHESVLPEKNKKIRPEQEKITRERIGAYNAWYFSKTGELTHNGGWLIAHVFHQGENSQEQIIGHHNDVQTLPSNELFQALWRTRHEAKQIATFRSYDSIVYGLSASVILVGIYFYRRANQSNFRK